MSDNKVLTEQDFEKMEADQYEESAKFFHLSHRQFRQLGYRLADRKKRALVRVLEAVLFEPLEDVETLGKEEKEMVDFCRRVLYHKNKIIEFAHKRKEEAEKELENE